MKYSKIQLIGLVTLRVLIGWHFFYEGLSKLINPYWTSAGYLAESKWVLSGFFEWITKNAEILRVVDFLNIWGLILIGLALILGLFARFASYAGIILILLYYAAQPPLIGLESSLPNEGNYLIVNKNLIEAAALFILVYFPTSKIIGIDRMIFNKK